MSRYIAFLRAINVGGHTVTMDRLRALFTSLGFTRVETFIASGNVIFDAPSRSPTKLERNIEQHLQLALGYEVRTFLRTPAEVATADARTPFGPAAALKAGAALSIGFLKAPLAAGVLQKVLALRTEIDDFHVSARELYWLRHRTLGESKITGAQLEKALGGPTTLRNVTTVRKLRAKYHVTK